MEGSLINISSARFITHDTILATVDGIEMFIPVDERNSIYNAIMEWGIPERLQENTLTVPESVSRFQARAALHMYGLLEPIEEMIKNSDSLTQIAWADAVEFRRNSVTINALAQQLDITNEQLDQLFILASTIQA